MSSDWKVTEKSKRRGRIGNTGEMEKVKRRYVETKEKENKLALKRMATRIAQRDEKQKFLQKKLLKPGTTALSGAQIGSVTNVPYTDCATSSSAWVLQCDI